MSDPDRLRRVLLPIELAEAELHAKPAAAVVVLLQERGRGFEVLLVERATREGDPWSGHVGLPGGMHQASDGSLLATASRETREEIAIDLSGNADVLGHMAPRAPANRPDVLVVPFVALSQGGVEPSVSTEVTSTFWAPLAGLPETRTTTEVRTSIGPLMVPAFVHDGRVIWGFTYRVLDDLLALLERGG